MRRWLLLITFLAAACGGTASPEVVATTTSLVPEVTILEPAPTTTSASSFEVPAEVDVPYVQRVLKTISHLDGEATRRAYAAKAIDLEVVDRLEAIFSGAALAGAKKVLAENAVEGFVRFADPPADAFVRAVDLIQVTARCMVVRADLDYRPQQQFAGSVALDADGGEVRTIYAGTGRLHEPEPEPLSVILDRFNAQHGTEWSEADLLVFDAALADLVESPDVQVQAVNNSAENFGVVFPELFQKALLERIDRNESVVYRFLDDEELAAGMTKVYATLAQAQARVAYQEHCPIGELLGGGGENQHLEYKSTLRTDTETGEVRKPLETASLKTIAAFANASQGGTLLIGVADDGSVHGLANDHASLHKAGRSDGDRFLLHLNQLLINALGETAASTVAAQLHTVNGHDLCRVHVPPSTFPVDAKVVVEKKGQMETRTAFYVRIVNGTREITDTGERQKFIANRWGSSAIGGGASA